MLTGSGESDFATVRSAAGRTVVSCVVELFAVFGSNSSAAQLTLFVATPDTRACTVMVALAEPPTAILPSVQFTTLPAALQPLEALTKETPAGSVSLTVTFVAGSGPAFDTVIVYVKFCVLLTGFGSEVFVTEMSADGRTVVSCEALLFSVFGSNSGPVTETLFVIVPVLCGVTTTVTTALEPEAIDAMLHVTMPPAAEHPVDALTKTTAAGSVSVTTTFVAVSGPLFVTVIV